MRFAFYNLFRLYQQLKGFVYKELDGKYFRLCDPYDFFHNYLTCLCSTKVAKDNVQMNDHGWVHVQ